MKNKNAYRELVKNDPNFHDIRAKILLEAAQELNTIADEKFGKEHFGLIAAAKELRRMASNARRAHNKHQDVLRNQREASEAKAKAFGY